MATKNKPNRREFGGLAAATLAGLAVLSPAMPPLQTSEAFLPLIASADALAAACVDLSLPPYNVRVSNIHSAGFATTGVYFSQGTGSTFDATPELHAINNGSDAVWQQVDQNDNSITNIYPIIAGNRGGICTLVGQTDPESAVAALQGCEFIRQNGDSTTWWKKTATTTNVGWTQLSLP